MDCPRCCSSHVIKRGRKASYQRYFCHGCERYFTDRAPRFSPQTMALAVQMYLNSMGIRAIGRVLDASPAAVLKWIRQAHAHVQQRLAEARPAAPDHPDIIAFDEIYTYVQKNERAPSFGPPIADGKGG